jgi:hypothetical protein
MIDYKVLLERLTCCCQTGESGSSAQAKQAGMLVPQEQNVPAASLLKKKEAVGFFFFNSLVSIHSAAGAGRVRSYSC